MAAAMLAMSGCSGSASESTEAVQAESAEGEENAAAETAAGEEYVAESSVKLGEYKGIAITVPKVEVTDEELETQVQQFLNSGAAYSAVERPAELGDQVNIDYKGLLDGVAFEGGTAEGFDLTLGSGQFIDGFEDGLVGAKKGEVHSLNLTFPDPYHNAEMAGKAVVFEVTVNEVKERILPELTDEFVAGLGMEVSTVEEFKEFLYDSLLQYEQMYSDGQRDVGLVNAVLENAEIVCATDEVEDAYNLQLNSYIVEAAGYGVDLGTYSSMLGMTEEEFKARIREDAKDTVRQQLVLKEIAAQENITATDEEKEELARYYGYENVEAMLKNVNITQELIDDTALMQKVLEFLAENAEITVTE